MLQRRNAAFVRWSTQGADPHLELFHRAEQNVELEVVETPLPLSLSTVRIPSVNPPSDSYSVYSAPGQWRIFSALTLYGVSPGG